MSPNENKEYIHSLLLKATLSGEIIETFDSLADLRAHLSSDLYYVARKGKKIIFKGELYKATPNDLLDFLGKSIKSKDLRELLISPVKAHPNNKVFCCTEDAFHMYAAE